jgi:AraC family transcriptional regulator
MNYTDVARGKEIFSAPWRIFSTEDTWPDFRLDEYRWPAMKLPARSYTWHTLSFNMGMPLHFSWKAGTQWNDGECNTGNIVGFLPATHPEEMLWEDEYIAFTLSFDPGFADRLLDSNGFRFKEQRNLNDAFLAQTGRALYQHLQGGNVAGKIFTESLVIALVVHLGSQYPANGKKVFSPKGKLSSRQLAQVVEYIHSFIHSNVSLTEMAACVHLSPFHFARLFRQTVGRSPYQFVLQLKIEYAKKLIRQYNGSLSEIAYTLNFTDQAHFSNVFKKVTGICPRQFMQARNR